MSKVKAKIDIKKIMLGHNVMQILMKIKGSIQVSIKPDGSEDCVIIGGQKNQVDDFIAKLKKEGLFLESSIIGKPIDLNKLKEEVRGIIGSPSKW